MPLLGILCFLLFFQFSNSTIPLIINDNTFIAKEIDAFGIHVGNSDTQPSVLRESSFQNKMIGYSIEYLEQLDNNETMVSDGVALNFIFD